MGAFESCEEEEAGEEEGAANEGAPSDEGEPPGGRSRHLHAIASHPQREQRVTESSGSEKVTRAMRHASLIECMMSCTSSNCSLERV